MGDDSSPRLADLAQARVLLETVLPAGFRGCAPYGAPKYESFLLAASSVPAAHSPLWLDLRRDHDVVCAVADWRQVARGIGWLNGMAVRADRRGEGLGRALLQRGFHAARRAGWRELQLHVGTENKAAQALYASAGFSDTGIRSWWSLQPVDLSATTDALVGNWAIASACLETHGFGDVELLLTDGPMSVRILATGVVRTAAESVRDPGALALAARLGAAREACFVHSGSERPPGRDVVEFQHWSIAVL